MSRDTHDCEMCGREFEGYMVPVRDNFVDIIEWQKRKEYFDHLCKWCNYMYFQMDWHGKREMASQYSDVDVDTSGWEDPRTTA